MTKRTVIIGVGGPVGSGKTLLLERLTRRMSDLNLAVITNDIYTKEDALFLAKNSSLDEDRIIGVETGGCPHTLQERFNHDLDVIFLESGGDNLAATFSPDLVDFTIYIIDVAQGEKIPRKAGQGMIKSDLFLINKTDLAPYVGANLDRMREDTLHFRNEDSFIFTNLNNDDNVKEVEEWIRKNFLLEDL